MSLKNILRRIVTRSSFGNYSEFYRLSRAVLDAGHTMRTTFFFPYGLSALHFDHMHRTKLYTFSARNTRIFYPELFCGLVNITQHRSNGKRDEILKQKNMPIMISRSVLYDVGSFFNF